MTEDCTLCGLPVDPDPITADDGSGPFCCKGCLTVWRTVDDVEETGLGREDTAETADLDAESELPAGHEEAFLRIDGMHCTTCEAFLHHRADSIAGVASVDASYATGVARVRFDPDVVDRDALPGLLSGYGYTARFDEEPTIRRSAETDRTLHRLLVGGVLGMLVMPWYVFFLYPSYVGIETGILTVDMTTPAGLYLPMGIVGVLSAGVVFYTGWPILRGAYVSLATHRPNMDLLLAVAILAAFAYSTLALATGSIHLYYDVSIMIVLVVTAGGYYEDTVKHAATERLSALATMQVSEAHRRLPDGTIETVDVGTLEAGDEVLVRPGERVPADGTVLEGVAAVDEALLTGESLPQTKRPGDEVVGGSVVTDSALVVTVGPAAESTLDRLTAMLWSVQSEAAGAQRFADRLATAFVPMVLFLGGTVAVWRLAAGEPASSALLAGLTVLVAACPCAMGLATPLAIAGGLRDALERGIVVSSNAVFETAPDLDTVVFDKTGTLTTGEMSVRRLVGDREALVEAAALETRSSHPVADAFVEHVKTATDGGSTECRSDTSDAREASKSIGSAEVSEFERHPGEGVSGRVDGDRIVVGTPELVERVVGSIPGNLRDPIEDARNSGQLPVVVGRGEDAAAVAVVGDRERAAWESVLESFEDERVVVLTGDRSAAGERFRDHPAVDRVVSGVPPDGKAATIRAFRTDGPTAMVGDGTNDAPALGLADVGVVLAGTARAADAADVAIIDGSLEDVPAVFELATATRRRIRENVGWALCYNAVAIPLAAAGVLNPLFAAVAMAASSLLVVTNSRRPLLALSPE